MAATSKDQSTFLTKDPAIRGQNWVCLSFVSPEDVLIKRELYELFEFLKPLASDVRELIDNSASNLPADMVNAIRQKYSYLWNEDEMKSFFGNFRSQNCLKLENDYRDKFGAATNVRAVKVRGVFDSMEEAHAKCRDLRDFDNGMFNIYVASVGCWCPWSPDPNEISDNVFMDDALQKLMTNYVENARQRDKMYQARVFEMSQASTEEDKGDDVHELFNVPDVAITRSDDQPA